MATIDVMRRDLQAVQRGDWARGTGRPGRAGTGPPSQGAVEIRRADLFRPRGDQTVEVWIFEANQ